MKLKILLLLTFILPAISMADKVVRISTSVGDIKVRLAGQEAPQTVKNFLSYVKKDFYAGTVFHRVIDGFMIQGGGFDEKLMRKKTADPIKIESNNGLLNRRGTIAMARTMEPNSATSQFFINLADNDFLNYRSPDARGWGYAVFGNVISGMSVVDKIAKLKTGPGGPFQQDVPFPLVTINKIEIIK